MHYVPRRRNAPSGYIRGYSWTWGNLIIASNGGDPDTEDICGCF